MTVHIISKKKTTDRFPREAVAVQPFMGIRPRPIEAYQGQSMSALAKGLNPYDPDFDQNWLTIPPVRLYLYALQNANFVIGNGLDGAIIAAGGELIHDASCFSNLSVLGPDGSIPYPESPTKLGTVFIGCDAAWHTYYHWIAYGLAKCWMANQLLPKDCEIVVPDYSCRVGVSSIGYTEQVYNESISLAGLSGRLTQLPPGVYSTDTLFFLWADPAIPTGIIDSDEFQDFFSSLRDEARRRSKSPSGSAKRYIISRSRANSARTDPITAAGLLELADMTSFDQIYLEDLPLSDQILAMSEAECVVGPHGAGLLNTAFMQRGSTLLELNKELDGDGSLRACFYQMSSKREINYMFLNQTADVVDKHAINRALSRLI